MKKSFSIIVALVVIIAVAGGVVLYLDLQKNAIPIYWEDMPKNTNPNLKYFGYYHFGGDIIEEVASFGHSNMCKVDGDYTEELIRLIDNGFQVFVMIRHMFFESQGTPADWEERWESVKATIDPYIDKILGFYVDEPIRYDLLTGENIGKSMEAFHFACQTVRADYPNKKMMAVLTINDLSKKEYSREYYKYCTDLGYDFYLKWNKKSVLNNISVLENYIAVDNQNIWLIPKGFYTVDFKEDDLYWLIEPKDIPPGEDVLDWIKGSYEIAVADERIVGLFCFVYDNEHFTIPLRKFFLPDSDYYNEEVYGVYNQIGHAVIANCK